MRSLALGIVLATLGLAACSPQPQQSAPSPTPSATPGVPPLKITGQGTAAHPWITIVDQKGNRREYVLLTRSYESHTAAGVSHATFHPAIVTFYNPAGQQLTAQAPQGVVDEASNTVMLAGGVVAHTIGGQGAARNVTLYCDTLTYDRGTGLIHGEGHVRMANTSGMNFTGTRFDSDITLANIRMQ